MEQKTGIGSLYDEFLRGYGAEISLFVLEFLSNSTYKPTYPPSFRTRVAMALVPRSVEPDREAEELAPEDALEPSPNLGRGEFALLQVRGGGRALGPEDQVELAGLGEDPAEVHATAIRAPPEGDELAAGEQVVGLVEEGDRPTLDHLLGDLDTRDDPRLLRVGNPLVVVVVLGHVELPRLAAQGEHRSQVIQGRAHPLRFRHRQAEQVDDRDQVGDLADAG